MKRVLVTGGAGFIGSNFVRSLAADGVAITVIDDLSTGSSENLPPGVELIDLDIAHPSVSEAIASASPDVVIHAAAQVNVTQSVADPERDYEVNVQGTKNVLAGASAAACGRFVFLSSGGAVYGEADGATEDANPAPASPYGRNKLLAEGLIAASGISYANARLANVYGPGQRAGLEGGVVAIFMHAATVGDAVTIYGDGSQSRDFVFVDDVVSALRTLARSDRTGTWNVGTGIATSVHDLLDTVEQVIGHHLEHEHKPARIGEVHRSRLSLERISLDTGWVPGTSLRAGLVEVLSARVPS